jgi:hypothetical protein
VPVQWGDGANMKQGKIMSKKIMSKIELAIDCERQIAPQRRATEITIDNE